MFLKKSTAHLLIVHGEQWYISDGFAIRPMCTRLQKVLKALVVLSGPGHGEEICIVDCPVRQSRRGSISLRGNSRGYRLLDSALGASGLRMVDSRFRL